MKFALRKSFGIATEGRGQAIAADRRVIAAADERLIDGLHATEVIMGRTLDQVLAKLPAARRKPRA